MQDGLGSVRQLAGPAGEVTLAQGYTPFGVPLWRAGRGASVYGFTGERWDGGTELLYLRARYMQPAVGRFVTRDAWSGNGQVPLSKNRYVYALANPVKFKDSSGFYPELPGPVAFAWCFDLHSLLGGHYSVPVGSMIFEYNVSAQTAVDICRRAYTQDAWSFMRSTFNLDSRTPVTAHELFGWYLYENGGLEGKHLWFDGNHPLTRELAKSWWVHLLRLKYYLTGDVHKPIEQRFNKAQFLASIGVDIRNSWYEGSLPISFLLGSFRYQIWTVANGERVGWRIDNDTTLESGTHIVGRFHKEGFEGSVENLINSNPDLQNKPFYQIISDPNKYKIISILHSRKRGDDDPILGGGTMYETFSWTEKRDVCKMLLPFPVALDFLDIRPWPGFLLKTSPVVFE